MYGISFRGSATLGTDRVVTRFLPKTVNLKSAKDTILTRFLTPVPDTTKEVVRIVVEAFDVGGRMSADTTRVTLGGPSVQLLNLIANQSVQAGLSLSLQMVAADPHGIIGRTTSRHPSS
jgi:hypothetical protein